MGNSSSSNNTVTKIVVNPPTKILNKSEGKYNCFDCVIADFLGLESAKDRGYPIGFGDFKKVCSLNGINLKEMYTFLKHRELIKKIGSIKSGEYAIAWSRAGIAHAIRGRGTGNGLYLWDPQLITIAGYDLPTNPDFHIYSLSKT
jgi:hypothetical protein